MPLLIALSMVRSKDNIDNPNSIDNLPAHYIAKRAISEGYINAGYALEGATTFGSITTPKNNIAGKPISHDQDVSGTMSTETILGIAGGLVTGFAIIGSVGIAVYRTCKSSDSKNENVDPSIDINLSITIPKYVEETQDISLAGNTTTQVEQ